MLANNFTLGIAFGTYGAFLSHNEQAFGVARDTISFGMSAVSTTLGLSALIMGNAVRRLTPRRSIAIGMAATACALAGLGLTTSFAVAMAMWALLGFGAAMAAILGPVAIAAEYFPGRSGKMLALTNLPLVLFVGPWAVTTILAELGREGTYLLLAALLLPVLALVLRLRVGTQTVASEAQQFQANLPLRAIMSRKDFWLLSLGIAVIAATGTAYTVHAIPFGRSAGLSGPASAVMLSVYSGAGLAGVPLFGWLADRIGAPRALALSGGVQCVSWAGLALAPPGGFLFLSAMLGAATTPLTMLHGTAMAQMFGGNGAGRAMGYSYAIKLPFLFMASPIVGYAYLQMGDYRPAFLAVAASLMVAVVLLSVASLTRRRPRAQVAAEA
ncbi:MFS transporter [Blastomonas sp.]|uniref:MFS transporter n=1 Tax=Blastomonas sp. TaxID=1909299 RepID=UPI00406A82D2